MTARHLQNEERVTASFKGLAIGDAIGKQTETLAHADVRKWYPNGIEGFHGQPGEVIPRYVGRRYEWRVGETTDDTEQTIAVARALLRAGQIDHEVIGTELLHCRKSVHPGVRIWAFQQGGDPARIASEGDGCGAAMRVAPIGVVHRPHYLNVIVRGAYETSIPTHGGQLAVCAAAAVAAAVSTAIDGQDATQVLAAAVRASQQAEALRPATATFSIGGATEEICSWLVGRTSLSAEDIAQKYFPGEPRTIVPLAIGLALVTESAEQTAILAANVGGDSDSVASIGGAIAGALCPRSVNDEWFQFVRSVNPVECGQLIMLAAALAERRFGG